MIDRKITYTILVLLTLGFAACSQEDIVPKDDLKDTPITIQSAGVAELSTRAGTPSGTLTSGSLSFFSNNESEDEVKYVADNEKWTYTDGEWQFDAAGSDTQQLLWKGTGNQISWFATYPYRDYQYSVLKDGMQESVPVDQTDGTKWAEYDLLWAAGTATSNSVNVEFKHLFTKFSLNLTYGTEVDPALTVKAVAVGKVYVVRVFQYGTLTWGAVRDGTTDVKALALETPNYIDANEPSKGTYNASFEALIVPQTAAPVLTIEMNDGSVFATTLTQQDFQSGYHYSIKLKVGKDKVELGGITADAWTEVTMDKPLETE